MPENRSVSLAWVLNQLAGMKFPGQGEAYDYIKKSVGEWAPDETPSKETENEPQRSV